MSYVCRVRALIGFCVLLTVAACGGGGSSDPPTGNSLSSSSSSASSSSSQSSDSSSTGSLAGLTVKPRYLIASGNNQSGSSSAGVDIFLYASNSLATPTFIKYSGVVRSWGVFGGKFIYFHVETDGKVHLYGLRLDDVTVTPVPQQISTLELPSPDAICGVNEFSDNENDSTTLKMILRVAGDNQTCGDNDDFNEIISLSDISSPPQTTELQSDFGSFFYPMYDQAGNRLGILYDDKKTSTLTITKQSDLSQSLPIIPHDPNLYNYTLVYPNWQYDPFFIILPNGGINTLYRASLSGDSKALYSAKGIFAMGPSDSNNVYFSDFYPNSFDVYKVPLTSTGQPTLLFSEQASYDNRRALLTSTDSRLIMFRYDATGNVTHFQSIPVASYSTTATDFKTYTGRIIDRITYKEPAHDLGSQKIIVTRWDGTAQNPGYVTDIFDTNGVATLPSMNKVLVKRALDWTPKLVAYKGMTDTNGNYSNATFNDFDINTGAMISYKNPDGSEFRVGDGQVIMFDWGGLEYAVAHMGYPDPNDPEFYLDGSKPSVALIFDFVSRVIYQMPSSTSGETLFY
ncbi:MAG TPA: hypothetical protein VG962_01560 [Steroidobacteraceae bacterium]|nr:hypothetical protein [Steroidobacteraceae bacterium]